MNHPPKTPPVGTPGIQDPFPPPQRKISGAIFWLAAAAAIGALAGRDFLNQRESEVLFPSPGLTVRRLLSDYFPPLRNTPGDTEVFVFAGARAGGRILVLGGSHPNEPAGFVASVVLVENLRVAAGTFIVVPQANRSGFTHSDPQEGSPQRFTLDSPSGRRWFRLGSRVTNPVHQWPDPILYVNPGGQALAGIEARNLNRAYPGKPAGTLTERVAFAVTELIRREKIDLGIDLHESAPEYPVINAIVFNESAAETAALAQMELDGEGLEFRLEASPPNLRGLSHREWGEASGINHRLTGLKPGVYSWLILSGAFNPELKIGVWRRERIKAVLLETPNASHGRLKGKTSAALIVDGKDKYYERAAKLGRLFVPYGPEGIPLRDRVARHVAGISALLKSLAELDPDKEVRFEGLPTASDIRRRGIGAFLR
jgi:hypothetical protein